jgi:hypothetical protein
MSIPKRSAVPRLDEVVQEMRTQLKELADSLELS